MTNTISSTSRTSISGVVFISLSGSRADGAIAKAMARSFWT